MSQGRDFVQIVTSYVWPQRIVISSDSGSELRCGSLFIVSFGVVAPLSTSHSTNKAALFAHILNLILSYINHQAASTAN